MPQGTRPPILVVEDSSDLREFMTYALTDADFVVHGVADGAEALEYLADGAPAVVILDLMLPVINGLRVLEEVRQHPRLARVPVLVTTGTMCSEGELRLAGATAVLRKPFEGPRLVATVRAILATSKFAASKTV
ncbi:MAG TPA: response regulator [Vicinamibacterales bacterium]|nr:response regulator [Vicinamibacterales bacterium]